MTLHWHSRHENRNRRWWLTVGKFEWRGEISWRWRHGFIATIGYGGQEDFAETTWAVPGLFLHLAFDTPFKWHRLRPFDGKYGESERKVGLRSVAGTLYLLVGHDSMGSYYSVHGRGGVVGRIWRELWRNQQVVLFDSNWILGKPRHSLEVLEENIPLTVKVGQWDGDEYAGTAKHTRRTWKRRFSTKVSDGYEIDMQQGVPFPGKGENSWDCGDDAYYGFGGETIESAIDRIVAEVVKRRGKNWRPEGVPA